MILYRIRYSDPDHGNCVAWAGTQAEARKRQKELEKTYARFNVDEFEPVDVPTSKPGLLAWIQPTVTEKMDERP